MTHGHRRDGRLSRAVVQRVDKPMFGNTGAGEDGCTLSLYAGRFRLVVMVHRQSLLGKTCPLTYRAPRNLDKSKQTCPVLISFFASRVVYAKPGGI